MKLTDHEKREILKLLSADGTLSCHFEAEPRNLFARTVKISRFVRNDNLKETQ